ncbi:MAG: HD domain-containing phosphohydrolase [Candidatus Omnitrophota bacterium]
MLDKHEEKIYEHELYKRLSTNISLREFEAILSRQFGKPVWWMLHKVDKNMPITLDDIEQRCEIVSGSYKDEASCLIDLGEAFNRTKRTKHIEYFKCPSGLYGFCYPIVQGRKTYGYIAMCHAGQEIPRVFIDLFTKFVDALVREIQKELQLSKLYETIRPRAIALSTVHTIHRLLTSTLDLDELLPRMARLSLQIVRAQRCSIKLVDKAQRTLLPKVTVDLRKKSVKLKKVKVGMYAPGKAFKNGKAILGKDYMAVPLIDKDVIGVITLYDKVDGSPFNHFDQEIMSTLSEQAVIAINNALLYKDQERMTEGTIKSLAALLDIQAPGRLTPRAPFVKIVMETGRYLRMSQDELKSLEYAYLLHDVGKAILPASVLTKSEKLTGKEHKLVREHPLIGAKIIKHLKALKVSAPMILHQRERFDGRGYPDKLKGRKIPLGARIISVVSAFEAMITKGTYRARKSAEAAVEEIRKNAGTQFDPKVVDAFLRVVDKKHTKSMLKREDYGDR